MRGTNKPTNYCVTSKIYAVICNKEKLNESPILLQINFHFKWFGF